MSPPAVRCAIYTRKSNDEKPDAQLTTLANQRDYCAAYVASHGGEGWIELADHYDDGGYSGGSLKRPALTRLRADIAAGRVDVVIVYKVDRLSRSLRDFANLVAEFDQYGVSFAAVTQAFDTATSMGRLTLNVLLSFAQFERELTSERLKDWFAGARARTLWIGPRPLGYRVVDLRLIIDPDEAALVRKMFQLYILHGSGRRVANEMTASGFATHRGGRISSAYVTRHIQSPLYRGHLVHRGEAIPGSHEPIISQSTWRKAQAAMAASARRRSANKQITERVPSPLAGLIFGPSGHAMVRTFAVTRGRLYRYYISALVTRKGREACPIGRLRADDLESEVARLLGTLPEEEIARITATGATGHGVTDRQRRAHDTADFAGLVRRNVARIDVQVDGLAVSLKGGRVLASGWAGGRVDPVGAALQRSRRAPTALAGANAI